MQLFSSYNGMNDMGFRNYATLNEIEIPFKNTKIKDMEI